MRPGLQPALVTVSVWLLHSIRQFVSEFRELKLPIHILVCRLSICPAVMRFNAS